MATEVLIPNVNQEKKPFTEAHITIIEGAQGEGKSVTAVARLVDPYHMDCVKIFCREQLKLNCEVKMYDHRLRVAKIAYNGETKYIRIPSNYKLRSPIQIHANFHLYGIPFWHYKSFGAILDGLKSGKILDGYLAVDEYYIGGNARESMSALGRELNKQSFQYRKMRLEVIIVTPMARLIDWTARLIPTEHILCRYNKKTHEVTLTIRKKGQRGTKEVSYKAYQYWPYYWTDERINA